MALSCLVPTLGDAEASRADVAGEPSLRLGVVRAGGEDAVHPRIDADVSRVRAEARRDAGPAGGRLPVVQTAARGAGSGAHGTALRDIPAGVGAVEEAIEDG